MDNNKPVSPLIFTEYDKISDTLMWLGNSKYQVKFVVQMGRKKFGKFESFHKEFLRYSDKYDKNVMSIRRDYSYYYSIERAKGLEGSVMLRPNDVEILKYIINTKIYPWFFGGKNIYGINQNKELCLKKSVMAAQITLNEASYMKIRPIVYKYELTNELKQGVSMEINDKSNKIEISIDTFLQFTNIILNTDMAVAAMTMLNYVKIKPYGQNLMDMNNLPHDYNDDNSGGGFFGR